MFSSVANVDHGICIRGFKEPSPWLQVRRYGTAEAEYSTSAQNVHILRIYVRTCNM